MDLINKVKEGFPGLETQKAIDEHRNTVLEFMDKDITVTTYRTNVPEGIPARMFYKKMGFVEGKLTEEFGSPVQEFVLKR